MEFARWEDAAKKATVKVRFVDNPRKDREYSTGTIIGHADSKTIILTVAHVLRGIRQPSLYPKLLEVVFHGSEEVFPAEILLFRKEAEILLLTVDQSNQPPSKLLFAPKDEWNLVDFQPLMCVSHPIGRAWRCGSGMVHCPEFFNDGQTYDKKMVLFDHDLEVTIGSSGAGLLNKNGFMVGIHSSDIRHSVQAISAQPLKMALDAKAKVHAAKSSIAPRQDELWVKLSDLKLFSHDVVDIQYPVCGLKQAVHVKYLDSVLRECCKIDKDKELSLNEMIERNLRYF